MPATFATKSSQMELIIYNAKEIVRKQDLGGAWTLVLRASRFVTAQDERSDFVVESCHINQIEQKRQQLGSDQPDVAGTLHEIVGPVTDGESAGEVKEEKARHQ
jgi:hypothetical protein